MTGGKSEAPVPDVKSAIPKHTGHWWEPAPGITPCIASVVKSVCEAGYIGSGSGMKWLLDYTFTPFGRYRVGSPKAPWRERHAFEAHLYPPGARKWEDTTDAGVAVTQSIYITFHGGEAAGLAPLVESASYARFKDPMRRLAPLMERALRAGLDLGDAGFWQAQVVLCEILDLLTRASHLRDMEYLISDDIAVRRQCSEFVQAAREYLQERLGEPVTRDDLARHLHVSVFALSHRYQQETGESPMQTLSNMRVNLAKSLLSRGYRLKHIAAQTGFYDEYHLSKTFKRMEGVSPAEFRRRHDVASSEAPGLKRP